MRVKLNKVLNLKFADFTTILLFKFLSTLQKYDHSIRDSENSFCPTYNPIQFKLDSPNIDIAHQVPKLRFY